MSADEQAVGRFGDRLAFPLTRHRHGEVFAAVGSAPTAERQCQHTPRAKRAQFIIEAPDGPTGFSVTVGRWVTSTDLDGWLAVSTTAFTGVTIGELFAVEIDTRGCPVGIFVSALTGAVAAGTFAFWCGGVHTP